MGSDDVQTARSMNQLAAALDRDGHRAEAAKLYHEAFDVRTRRLGPDHPETLESLKQPGRLASRRRTLQRG